MKHLLLYIAVITANVAISQEADKPCCTIIDLKKEAGTFTIRDVKTGRVLLFKPDALEGAELKVGDSIDADFNSNKVTLVKGASRSYDLMDAIQLDSCCVIMKIDTLEATSVLITAKNNTTGDNIRFRIPKLLALRLAEGNLIFTQPSHGYAIISDREEADTTKRILFGFPLLQENETEAK